MPVLLPDLVLVDGALVARAVPIDLVAVDHERIEFAASRLLPALVVNGNLAAVTDVWAAGRRISQGGPHPLTRAIVTAAERALEQVT